MLTCLVSVEHIDPPTVINNRTTTRSSDSLSNVIQMKWYKEDMNTRTINAIDNENNGAEYIRTRYYVTPTFELTDTSNITTTSSADSSGGLLIKSNSIYYATKLTIRSIERIDSGHFHCTAVNGYGAVRKNYSLIVLEPPDKPLDVRADTVTSSSIKLRWQSPYDGNSLITEYIVSYRALTSSALPITISVSAQYADIESSSGGGATLLGRSSKTITYQLADLIPFTSYSIQLKAKNSVGYSSFTDPVTAKTAEERKLLPN